MASIFLFGVWVTAWTLAPLAFFRRALRGGARSVGWVALGVAVAAPGLWAQARAGWPGDSFHTLFVHERVIVAALATALALIYLRLVDRLARLVLKRVAARALAAPLAVTAAVAIFIVGFALSPQVFYAYYRLVFEGLPAQWVINPGLTLERLRNALVFPSDGALADQAAALLFWTGVGLAVARAAEPVERLPTASA